MVEAQELRELVRGGVVLERELELRGVLPQQVHLGFEEAFSKGRKDFECFGAKMHVSKCCPF